MRSSSTDGSILLIWETAVHDTLLLFQAFLPEGSEGRAQRRQWQGGGSTLTYSSVGNYELNEAVVFQASCYSTFRLAPTTLHEPTYTII